MILFLIFDTVNWSDIIHQMVKMAKLIEDILRGKIPIDEQLEIELEKLNKFFDFVLYINQNHIDPFSIPFARIYDKYEIPKRLAKRRDSYKITGLQ